MVIQILLHICVKEAGRQHLCPCPESMMLIAHQEQEAVNLVHIVVCANLPVNVRLHQVLLQLFQIIVLYSMSDSEYQNLIQVLPSLLFCACANT